MDAEALERAIDAWREHDAHRAIHEADRAAIDATEAARSLVLELLAKATPATGAARAGRPGRDDAPPRDLFNAFARLGRLLAELGASPSLTAATVDGAARALTDAGLVVDEGQLAAARASVTEGYVAVAQETERAAARRAWEYPACAARISKDAVAVVSGYPSDDPDAVGDWAARVALAASRDGVKRAVVAGTGLASAEVARALGLVGITVVESLDAGGRASEGQGERGETGTGSRASKGWLSFLRQK